MAADLSIKPVPVSIDVLMPVHAQADRQQLGLKLLGLSLFPS